MQNYTIQVTDRLLRFDTTNDDWTVTMLPFDQTPNAPYEIHRISTGDGHTVTIQTDSTTGPPRDFLLPDGTTALVLDDTTYTVYIKIPDNGQSPAYVSWGSGGGGGGGGGGDSTPPPDVVSVDASGTVNPITGFATVKVHVIPPSPTGTFTGCHLYCEVPDQSADGQIVVGSAAIGAQAVTGSWKPVDIGHYPFVAAQQPWTVTFVVPAGVNPSIDVPSRMYAVSYSAVVENQLIEANQTGATPNEAFTLVPGTVSDASATNVTSITDVTGSLISLVVNPLEPVNTDGKLKTPFVAIVSDTPQGIDGWAYRLILTYKGTDPTDPKQQFVLTGYFKQAGIVPSGPPDGISVPHSFTLDTPKDVTYATIWLQAGLVDSSGVFAGNNIVPGATASCDVVYGSTVGTTDAAAIMTSTIDQSMAVVNGLFGIASDGVTSALLGPGSVSTINVQALAITNPLLASLAVAAGNIQNSAVGSTQLAAQAVATSNLQDSSVTNAILGPLAVAAGNMASGSVTNQALAAAAVTAVNLAALSVTQGALANLAVATANLQQNSVTSAILGNASVTAAAIGLAAVGSAAIATAAIGSAAIQNGAILAAAIGSAAIGTGAIQQAAITEALIANLAVSGAKIQTATITGANIATATIADANIGTVSASKIIAGTVMASVSINAPIIQGGSISGTTISGVTISGVNLTGTTLVLNQSGITTTISNFTTSTSPVGLEVKNNATGWWGRVSSQFIAVSNVAGGTDWESISMSVTSGGGVLSVYGNNPNVAVLVQTSGGAGQLYMRNPSSAIAVTIDASQTMGSATATLTLTNTAGLSITNGYGAINMAMNNSLGISVSSSAGFVGVGTSSTYAELFPYGLDIYNNGVFCARFSNSELLINNSNGTQRILLNSNNGGVPVIGVGYTDTNQGFVDIWQDRMEGYGTGNSLAYKLTTAGGYTGALYLFNNGSEIFRIDAANASAGSANAGGNGTLPPSVGGYFVMYLNGQPKKVPYYSN